MKLLIIAIVLVLVHLFRPTWPRVRHQVFEAGFRLAFSLSGRIALDDRVGAVLLTAGVTGIVFAVQHALGGLTATWPWFLFSLAILLVAWGSRDLDEDVESYLDAESEAEAQRAASVLLHCYDGTGGTAESVIKGVFYQALVRWFGVLFWFLVAGAAGAIAFRLPHAMLSSPWIRERAAASHTRLLRWIVALLDLPPAVLTTLSLAVVGNFDAVITAWRESQAGRARPLLDLDRGFLPEVGYQVVCDDAADADGFDHTHSGAGGRVQAAMSLVWRALIAWLTVIALLIVGGLVS